MGKLRVTIDREQCIGDMVCANLCPQVFAIDEESKSVIVDEYRESPDNPSVGIVPDELEECVENAASGCPVGIITYEKIE